MKKILIIFILLFTVLNAVNNYELKLYEKILPSIFMQTPIRIFADKEIKEILKSSDKFKLVNNCDKTVVLLIGHNFSNIPNICKDKPQFATNYNDFKKIKNSFGAFYWRKGRPQIRFKTKVINRYSLTLPNSLRKYAK
jgi:hypothetical protein